MTYPDAIILGLIQGITEFIPVSSSGHLIVTSRLLGNGGNTFNFDVILNIGTLLALVIYFRGQLWGLITEWRRQRRLTLAIILSTLPAVVLGFLLQPVFETHARSVWLVIVLLAVVGLAMIGADRLPERPSKLIPPSRKDAVIIGIAQSFALIPGVSRSGATILGARVLGFNNERAARYSFLIAIPIITGALLKVGMSEEGMELLREHSGLVVAGNIASAVGGLFAIAFMLRLLQRIGLRYFGIYRLILAFLLLLLTMNGVISA